MAEHEHRQDGDEGDQNLGLLDHKRGKDVDADLVEPSRAREVREDIEDDLAVFVAQVQVEATMPSRSGRETGVGSDDDVAA